MINDALYHAILVIQCHVKEFPLILCTNFNNQTITEKSYYFY